MAHRGCTWKAGSREEGLRGIPRPADPFQSARLGLLKIRGVEGNPRHSAFGNGWGKVGAGPRAETYPSRHTGPSPGRGSSFMALGQGSHGGKSPEAQRAGVGGLTTKGTR